MIKYIKGDLFTTDADVIAHGCNCVGGFGSGVAGQIAKLYPKVKEKYLLQHEQVGWKLGDVQFVRLYGGNYIANCATQLEYFPRNKCHADYEAIETVMNQLLEFVEKNNFTIAIPKIGAGLAGGSWDEIEKIINKVFANREILVYTLD